VGLATAAILSGARLARAQDAGAPDAGTDPDVFEHRPVAYDPQRSMGYGGCGVGSGAGDPAFGALLALGAAARLRRRRAP
jgi:MYXO-CTERM domain-containing protein